MICMLWVGLDASRPMHLRISPHVELADASMHIKGESVLMFILREVTVGFPIYDY